LARVTKGTNEIQKRFREKGEMLVFNTIVKAEGESGS